MATLYIALSYDWMRQYADAMLRERWAPGSHIVVGIHDDADRQRFAAYPEDCVHFFRYPTGWLAGKRFALRPRRVEQFVDSLVETAGIDRVVSLTIDLPMSYYLPRLQQRVDITYVVHNVEPHAVTRGTLRQRLFYKYFYAAPLRRLVRGMRHQLTNARWQQRWLQERFPDHRVDYEPFPSLVDAAVAQGTRCPAELGDQRGYYLFFGRVEAYKGVERLIDIYASHPELHSRPLVIAGVGEMQTPIPAAVADRVVRIARYIADDEVAELYRRAALVVYPYLAATQSGVLSIAVHFGRPVLATDIPYFREVAPDYPNVTLASIGDFPRLLANLPSEK